MYSRQTMSGCRPSWESLRIDAAVAFLCALHCLSDRRFLYGSGIRIPVQAAFGRLVFLHALYYNAKQSEHGARHLKACMLYVSRGVRVKEL